MEEWKLEWEDPGWVDEFPTQGSRGAASFSFERPEAGIPLMHDHEVFDRFGVGNASLRHVRAWVVDGSSLGSFVEVTQEAGTSPAFFQGVFVGGATLVVVKRTFRTLLENVSNAPAEQIRTWADAFAASLYRFGHVEPGSQFDGYRLEAVVPWHADSFVWRLERESLAWEGGTAFVSGWRLSFDLAAKTAELAGPRSPNRLSVDLGGHVTYVVSSRDVGSVAQAKAAATEFASAIGFAPPSFTDFAALPPHHC